MSGMTLAEFLLARLAEDDAAAFFASQDEQLMGSLAEQAVARDDHRGTHAARWSPSRVLAECEAKRRIVDVHRARGVKGGPPYVWACAMCDSAPVPWEVTVPWPCQTLRLLAVPYADHPDYDESWRP